MSSCNDTTTTTDDTTTTTTLCDRDRVNNVWIEGVTDPETGEGGICLLDTMTEAQIINSLERDEVARADLLRVTSNERLLELAAETPRLQTEEPEDQLQRETNKHSESIPYYSQFRGNPPFNQ